MRARVTWHSTNVVTLYHQWKALFGKRAAPRAHKEERRLAEAASDWTDLSRGWRPTAIFVKHKQQDDRGRPKNSFWPLRYKKDISIQFSIEIHTLNVWNGGTSY